MLMPLWRRYRAHGAASYHMLSTMQLARADPPVANCQRSHSFLASAIKFHKDTQLPRGSGCGKL